MLKQKRQGASLEIKTFDGSDGNRYVVFRTLDGSYHTFVEVEAKEVEAKDAARKCGAEGTNLNTRQMWESIWIESP